MRNYFQSVADVIQPFSGFIDRVLINCSHADVIHTAGHHEQAGFGKNMHRMERGTKTPTDGGRIGQSSVGGSREICGKQHVSD